MPLVVLPRGRTCAHACRAPLTTLTLTTPRDFGFRYLYPSFLLILPTLFFLSFCCFHHPTLTLAIPLYHSHPTLQLYIPYRFSASASATSTYLIYFATLLFALPSPSQVVLIPKRAMLTDMVLTEDSLCCSLHCALSMHPRRMTVIYDYCYSSGALRGTTGSP